MHPSAAFPQCRNVRLPLAHACRYGYAAPERVPGTPAPPRRVTPFTQINDRGVELIQALVRSSSRTCCYSFAGVVVVVVVGRNCSVGAQLLAGASLHARAQPCSSWSVSANRGRKEPTSAVYGQPDKRRQLCPPTPRQSAHTSRSRKQPAAHTFDVFIHLLKTKIALKCGLGVPFAVPCAPFTQRTRVWEGRFAVWRIVQTGPGPNSAAFACRLLRRLAVKHGHKGLRPQTGPQRPTCGWAATAAPARSCTGRRQIPVAASTGCVSALCAPPLAPAAFQGLPHVRAPAEAECMCAALDIAGLVDGCATKVWGEHLCGTCVEIAWYVREGDRGIVEVQIAALPSESPLDCEVARTSGRRA
eukprot:349691-Chlamydomonas_euryale.AAC.5